MSDEENVSPPSSQGLVAGCPPSSQIHSPPTSHNFSSDSETDVSQSSDSGSKTPTSVSRKRGQRSIIAVKKRLRQFQNPESSSDTDDEQMQDNHGNLDAGHQERLYHRGNNDGHPALDGDLLQPPAVDSDSSSFASEAGEDSAASDSDRSAPSTDSSVFGNAASSTSGESESDTTSSISWQFLFEGSNLTADEALLKVMKLYVHNRWTKASLKGMISLIHELLPSPNEFPPSSSHAFKKLEQLTASYSETEYEYCVKCRQLVDSVSKTCTHAEGSEKFFSFPLDVQVQHIFEQTGLAEIIDKYKDTCDSRSGECMFDIVDGSEYKSVRSKLLSMYDLVLLWFTDGLQLAKSSKMEMWLLLCTICEVPPRLRASFVIVCGVYVSSEKPNINVFLKPFREMLVNAWERGVSWVHPISKEKFVSKVIAPVLCADAPAKALCVVCKNYNDRYGCNSCEQKTQQTDVSDNEQVDEEDDNQQRRRRKPRLTRFLFKEDFESAPLRTGDRMDEQGELAEERGNSRKGVLGRAEISKFPHLDRALCICAEYMHLCLLGVVKYLLKKMFYEPGPWFIGNKLTEINEFISEIKVPDYVKRLPRGVNEFKYWKASELCSFLLYYSVPLFKKFFPANYYQHWLLFVASMCIYLRENISENDIVVAETMIKLFVRDIGRLYGDKCYTYNAYTLLHIGVLVRRWGPLWATSAFVFEYFNGFVASSIHGTKHQGKELLINVKTSQGLAILEKNVSASSYEMRPRHYVTEMLRKGFTPDVLDNQGKRVLSRANLGSYVLFRRARINSSFYSILLYDETKRAANSYIQYKTAEECAMEYGQILCFVKAEDSSFHCLVQVFNVEHVELVLHEECNYVLRNFIPISESQALIVLPSNCIVKRVLKVGSYLAIPVNSLEINL